MTGKESRWRLPPRPAAPAGARRERVAALDVLRGATVLSMIVYHACWDLVYLFHADWDWYTGTGAYIWQQSICWTFILLSGFCACLGSRPARRGLTVFACGALVTAATVLFMPEEQIWFGVLTLIGSCMLLCAPLRGTLGRGRAGIGLAVSAALFLLTRNVNRGSLGFEGLVLAQLPEALYRNHLSAYLGFPGPGFSSTDYFSLIPWLFLFLAGYFLFRLWGDGILGALRRLPDCPPLGALGRHSLPVYMLHQPVIYGLLLAGSVLFSP